MARKTDTSQDLFAHRAARRRDGQPLAERMRPRTLEEFVGQTHIVGPGKILRRAIERDEIPSLIFWGPPGSGKTTLARIIAGTTGAHFLQLSAVTSGVREIRDAVADAEQRRDVYKRRTILFIDEIHRFNKAQQDALLPHVEAGTLTLIGATTENPSFEVISALLSRAKVVRLEALSNEEVRVIVDNALGDGQRGLGRLNVVCEEKVRDLVAREAHGDARKALNTLEVAASIAESDGSSRQLLDRTIVEEALQRKTLLYDKAGEEHYNVVSAFIKSLRGSDPDAAVYWMTRMLEAGEDPLFIFRRMVIFASEDIGNADPRALQVVMAATDAFRFVGLPEGVLPMTQAVTYLAAAPKSNTALTTYVAARRDVVRHGPQPVPMHLRNAPTKLMKEMGYAKGYRYPHNYEGHYVAEEYLPDALRGRRYYQPSHSGEELAIRRRLKDWRTKAGLDVDDEHKPTDPPPQSMTGGSSAERPDDLNDETKAPENRHG